MGAPEGAPMSSFSNGAERRASVLSLGLYKCSQERKRYGANKVRDNRGD